MADWFVEYPRMTALLLKFGLLMLIAEIAFHCLRQANPTWQVWATRTAACSALVIAATALMPPMNRLQLDWLQEQQAVQANTVEESDAIGEQAIDNTSVTGLAEPVSAETNSAKSGHMPDLGFPPTVNTEAIDGGANETGSLERESVDQAAFPMLRFDSPGELKAVEPETVSRSASSWASANWWILFTCVWLAGVFIEFFRWAIGLLAARRIVHESDVATAETNDLLLSLCGRLNIAAPKLRTSQRVATPGVIGVFRPLILASAFVSDRRHEVCVGT